MQIIKGRLQGAKYLQANSFGGSISPSLIVLHDTAGRLRKGSSVEWFRSRECTTSAHFVVERDGTITQMVPCDRKAFHAGESRWGGRHFCNSFAIGIEIVNPGILDRTGKAWFGHDTAIDPSMLERKATPAHGDGFWLPYTPEQVAAVSQLCRAIVAEYSNVNEIVTHWQISPGRKIDTNPLFPLEDVRAFALGRIEPETADVPARPVRPPDAPPAGMAQSSEGNAALLIGTGSTTTAAVEISGAAAKVAERGEFTMRAFLIALATSPAFIAAVIATAGSIYIWLRRRSRLLQGG